MNQFVKVWIFLFLPVLTALVVLSIFATIFAAGQTIESRFLAPFFETRRPAHLYIEPTCQNDFHEGRHRCYGLRHRAVKLYKFNHFPQPSVYLVIDSSFQCRTLDFRKFPHKRGGLWDNTQTPPKKQTNAGSWGNAHWESWSFWSAHLDSNLETAAHLSSSRGLEFDTCGLDNPFSRRLN